MRNMICNEKTSFLRRNISVLLAAYRDDRYIAEQIASILPQLHDCDELLVSDDSPEGDLAIKQAVLRFEDPRMQYLRGPGLGTIKNVEFLLGRAGGDILVLCDQDDVWLPEKLARVRAHLPSHEPAVLLHDAKLTDAQLNITCESLFEQRNVSPSKGGGFWRNLIKNGFTGCCMALTKELLPYVLPFPAGIPMHDQWIGLRATRHGKVVLLKEPLILHRRHPAAQTGQAATSLWQKVRWRVRLIGALIRVR